MLDQILTPVPNHPLWENQNGIAYVYSLKPKCDGRQEHSQTGSSADSATDPAELPEHIRHLLKLREIAHSVAGEESSDSMKWGVQYMYDEKEGSHAKAQEETGGAAVRTTADIKLCPGDAIFCRINEDPMEDLLWIRVTRDDE